VVDYWILNCKDTVARQNCIYGLGLVDGFPVDTSPLVDEHRDVAFYGLLVVNMAFAR